MKGKYYLNILLLAAVFVSTTAQNSDYIQYDAEYDAPVTSVRLSPDGKKLFVGDQAGNLKILDAAAFTVLKSIEKAAGDAILDIEITPEQDIFFIASGTSIKLFDSTATPVTNWSVHNTTVWSMDLDPAGEKLVSAEMNKTFQLWDVFNGNVISAMRGHDDATLAVAFSNDGKYIASGSNDKKIHLWDAASKQVIATFQGLGDHIYDVEFSPDDKFIAACSKDNTIRIWNIEENRPVHLLKGHRDMVMEIEFSPDGKYLLSASADFTIRLWDVTSGEQLYSFIENEAAVLDIEFIGEGRAFASACMDHHLKIRSLDPEIFVLKFFSEAYENEMNQDPLFLPRQKGEKRSEYQERTKRAEVRKTEIIDKYYRQYLDEVHLRETNE